MAVLITTAGVLAVGGVAEAAITNRPGGPFGLLSTVSSVTSPLTSAPEGKKAENGLGQAPALPGVPAAPGVKAPALPKADEPLNIGAIQTVNHALDYSARKSVTLHAAGAEYIKPHFAKLALLPGDLVKVGDPKGKEVRYYTPEGLPVDGAALTGLLSGLTGLTGQEPGQLLDPAKLLGAGQAVDPGKLAAPVTSLNKWALSVPGDTAIVEVVSRRLLPSEALGGLGVNIDKFAKGDKPKPRHKTESVCGGNDKADAVCYTSEFPAEYSHAKPIARLLIDGTELCTAWRVGPNNRLLTNRHCIDTPYKAQNTEVWFNYQCATCGGYFNDPVTKVLGDQLLASDDTLDYALFTVRDFDKIKDFGFLELDVRVADKGEELYIPQHPGGRPKEIALTSDKDNRGNCKVDKPKVEGYAKDTDTSYFCDTEGGSSGSPVLSRKTHRVIALHHFGGCPNSGVRIDLIHAQIKDKL
ncbi:trypsin-like serine peptidase [Longispora albida]|uniref:trypsin-like serine peptidase n=1 Tax=Longispora albida TaxID=203523 RepID=UPI00035FB196|nr:serine protease [Longispora albida]